LPGGALRKAFQLRFHFSSMPPGIARSAPTLG
jgi:hypothetical protein